MCTPYCNKDYKNLHATYTDDRCICWSGSSEEPVFTFKRPDYNPVQENEEHQRALEEQRIDRVNEEIIDFAIELERAKEMSEQFGPWPKEYYKE